MSHKEKIETETIDGGSEPETRFGKFIDAGVDESLSRIRSNYENRKNPLENLTFHNTAHTKTVIRRVDKILEAVDADPTTRSIGKLCAGFHDAVQNWKDKVTENGYVMRDRSSFPNEEDSFKMARGYMAGVNEREGEKIFTEEDISLCEEAIMATKASGPGSWDGEHNTVVQPNLGEKSSLVACALALADIGAAGMDGGAQYVYEGNALFREENLDILGAMSEPGKIAAIPDAEKESFKKRMLNWSNMQIKFAEGRKARFEAEIAGLSDDAKDAVRKLFNKFDESIEAAKKKADGRKSMSFEELARDFGYE
jgi:hypothetical protein